MVLVNIINNFNTKTCSFGTFQNSDDTVMYELTPSSSFVFNLLCDEDRRIAAMKFNLVINGKSHPVNFSGLGNFCPYPPPSITRQKQMAHAYSMHFQCFLLGGICTVQLYGM